MACGSYHAVIGGEATTDAQWNPAGFTAFVREIPATKAVKICAINQSQNLNAKRRDAAKKALAAYNGFMQIGGGINPDNAAEWLEAGASHVIVTSYIFQDGQLNEERLQELVRQL